MNYQIELRHFNYFKVLAEELHFRKAAERLFIAQPGLTRQIKQMEEIYKVQLFERGKRYVRLTPAGQYLKEQVDSLFLELNNIQEHLEKIDKGIITSLKVGFIGSAAQSVLPKLLVVLNKEHPLIDISINEISNEEQIEQIHKNKLDIGFVRMHDQATTLNYLHVMTENFVLVVPKNSPISTDKELNFASLRKEKFILFSKEYSNHYYKLVMSIFEDHDFQPLVALRTVNAMSIFHLVAQGIGIAIVPKSLIQGYNIDVDFIDLKHLRQRTTLSIIWNKENNNPGIKTFLDTYNRLIHTNS
ncbi:LysR family transcriptional regulator [Sphingobacterium rhinopitheci]|uniref:LysR family transcriptional regulator n=1 Tax=Sphingobacterium rhinopitheci TaxID=2781960 RepID=UPI001F51CCE6|nr:LysR family transcriptional regulator [Sphingobacterium rhinopitheci]MCI0922451.1 LysR family transcriptional regulator [Sphingobacterium rhinopitheci]